MDRFTQFGMVVDWWVTHPHHRALGLALEAAFLRLWSNAVDDLLRKRRGEGRKPSTWAELEQTLAGGDQIQIAADAPFSGPVLPMLSNPVGLMRVAAALEMDAAQLMPNRRDWLAEAVCELIDASPAIASAYAEYRLSSGGESSAAAPVPLALASAWSLCTAECSTGDDCWEQICSAARQIGEQILGPPGE